MARPICPNAANHTPAPTGYAAWHAWADRMFKRGWRNRRPCKGCGLYSIWTGGRGEPLPPDETGCLAIHRGAHGVS